MSKTGNDDWKTPLGVYERALAEIRNIRQEFQEELQILKELKFTNENLKVELSATKAELQATKGELEATKAELQATKEKIEVTTAEMQASNERLENMVTESKKIANSAASDANNAKETANRVGDEIKSIKSEIENGSIVAQKALTLKGKDSQNWLKFHKVDTYGYHCFQVWKSDNTWHRVSGIGVDYRKLEQALEAWNWQEADEETFEKILEVASRKKEGNLREKDFNKFLYEELYTIDKLWLKYSKGHFGFSVQKRIYENLGGTQKYHEKIWQDFGQRVGWRVNNQWLWYRYLNFSIKAPPGHLPARLWDDWCGGGVGSFYSLMPKLINCNI
ncbi:GUN4 domain-containing protein [Aerosakkonema funiforme]|uniref:GUN4 domain-containing protein n=1 Tax=Aerosakkonema funiforme TaxID=1246630 RepID=UPI0035BB735A